MSKPRRRRRIRKLKKKVFTFQKLNRGVLRKNFFAIRRTSNYSRRFRFFAFTWDFAFWGDPLDRASVRFGRYAGNPPQTLSFGGNLPSRHWWLSRLAVKTGVLNKNFRKKIRVLRKRSVRCLNRAANRPRFFFTTPIRPTQHSSFSFFFRRIGGYRGSFYLSKLYPKTINRNPMYASILKRWYAKNSKLKNRSFRQYRALR